MAYTAFKMTKAFMHSYTTNKLVNGDALRPDDNDLIAQTIDVPMGFTPIGDGWRIMTGNARTNFWARVEYRHNIKAGR